MLCTEDLEREIIFDLRFAIADFWLGFLLALGFSSLSFALGSHLLSWPQIFSDLASISARSLCHSAPQTLWTVRKRIEEKTGCHFASKDGNAASRDGGYKENAISVHRRMTGRESVRDVPSSCANPHDGTRGLNATVFGEPATWR